MGGGEPYLSGGRAKDGQALAGFQTHRHHPSRGCPLGVGEALALLKILRADLLVSTILAAVVE